MRIRNSH